MSALATCRRYQSIHALRLSVRHAAARVGGKHSIPLQPSNRQCRLCHIEHGPHDAKFHALWNLLRDEHQALRMKGWSGEGFLSVGKRVGGSRRIPLHEVQRQARAAAEKRRAQNMRGSVTRLGGTMPPRGTDMRQVIADAVERRNKITKGCASGTKGAQKIADQASKGGLRTKAEVDDANNAAIARALQDLFERDEDEQLQEIYQPGPSGGLGWNPQTGLEMHDQGSSKQQTHTATSSPPPVPYASRSVVSSAAQPPASRAGRPISRLVAEAESKRQPSYSARTRRSTSTCEMKPSSVSIETHPSPTSFAAAAWNCGSCTFENHIDMPHCEMCGTSKPENIDLTAEDGTDFSHSRSTLAKKDKPLGWNCIYCNTYMETKWWTCSACGNLKPSS